jgi:hypothetical protein
MVTYDVRSNSEALRPVLYVTSLRVTLLAAAGMTAIGAFELLVARGTEFDYVVEGLTFGIAAFAWVWYYFLSWYYNGMLAAEVWIDSSSCTFVMMNGREITLPWRRPDFALELDDFLHYQQRPGLRDPNFHERYLAFTPTRGLGAISKEAFDGLLGAARAQGMQVTSNPAAVGRWNERTEYQIRAGSTA